MKLTSKNTVKWIALLLLMAHLFSLTACGNKQTDPAEINAPTESVKSTESTELAVTEVHSHEFVDGMCQCGASNGMEGIQVTADSGLNAPERKDSEAGMTLISSNGAGDPAGIRLNQEIETAHGHYYEMVYRFTSNVAGSVRFVCEGVTMYEEDTFDVLPGENEIAVRFAAGKDGAATAGLELGGLGAFQLTFTGISLTEVEEVHSHSFVNGRCECGETNGFAGVNVWTEGSLTPVTREDTENSMTVISTNAPGDWWKVKVEWPLAVEEGKTYEAVFNFTSDVAGTIKYHVGAAAFLDSQEYNVVAGSNTFKVRFTAGADSYSCLELGGLGAFRLTFTGISVKEVENP